MAGLSPETAAEIEVELAPPAVVLGEPETYPPDEQESNNPSVAALEVDKQNELVDVVPFGVIAPLRVAPELETDDAAFVVTDASDEGVKH